MTISDAYPYFGSFAGGAIAAGLAARPRLNTHIIKVVSLGGLAGTALYGATALTMRYVIGKIISSCQSRFNWQNDTADLTTLACVPLIGTAYTVAGTWLMNNRIGIPVPYKMASLIALVSMVGAAVGILKQPDRGGI